jgi:hypothetical protein
MPEESCEVEMTGIWAGGGGVALAGITGTNLLFFSFWEKDTREVFASETPVALTVYEPNFVRELVEKWRRARLLVGGLVGLYLLCGLFRQNTFCLARLPHWPGLGRLDWAARRVASAIWAHLSYCLGTLHCLVYLRSCPAHMKYRFGSYTSKSFLVHLKFCLAH